MKTKVKLVHNPSAGNEEHEKEELVALIKEAGYECTYASTKSSDWKHFDEEFEFVIAAGGDGTIRKVIKQLLKKDAASNTPPVALLPLGTANNIARSLGIEGSCKTIIEGWSRGTLKRFDVGKLDNLKDADFFIESFGFGLFPCLIEEMKNLGKQKPDTPDAELQTALKLMRKLTDKQKPIPCTILLDGVDYSGNYLMVEVMNIRSVGPNLLLAPQADVSDGMYDIFLLPESDQASFIHYIEQKLKGNDVPPSFKTNRAKNILIECDETICHVDDEVVKHSKKQQVEVHIQPGLLQFLIPG